MTEPSPLPPAPLDRSSLLSLLGERYDVATLDHPAVFTVAESSKIHRELPGGHTKNLFLKDKKGSYFLVTADQETDVDLKNLHKRIGAQGRLSFGKADAMEEMLGVAPGSVTAFAVVNDRGGAVRFVLDRNLMRHDTINCHPLTNEATTNIGRDDLVDFARLCDHDPLVADLEAGDD